MSFAVILALYSEGEANAVVEAVEQLPGGASITAVREGHILPMLLNFGESVSTATSIWRSGCLHSQRSAED